MFTAEKLEKDLKEIYGEIIPNLSVHENKNTLIINAKPYGMFQMRQNSNNLVGFINLSGRIRKKFAKFWKF